MRYFWVILAILILCVPAIGDEPKPSPQAASDAASDITIYLVGHAHIDMNWKWLWPETIDVCRNTFSTVSKLMDEFPNFIFSQSQPAAYLAMQQNAPAVFSTIKDRIKQGRWDTIGTTWVEGDTNMASGESIVRSILYGKRYMRKQFGVDSDVCWMPDTFGHAWTLPQILAKSGIKYYYFTRCNPGHPLFWWYAPDGSRVLAYSFGKYDSRIERDGMRKDAEAFTSAAGVNDYMRVYGVGDHGGGPTREMLQNAKELQKDPDYPKLKFSKVSDYFKTVLNSRKDFPAWKSELYGIFRGCYTSHADIKRWNRESENILPCAEKFSAIAAARWHEPYDASGFEQAWRNTCFNQFHDLLCGTAIHGSYDYSKELYEDAIYRAKGALNEVVDVIIRHIKTTGPGVPIVVFNPLSWPRTDTVNVASPFPAETAYVMIKDEAGKTWPGRNMGDRLNFTAHSVPAMGYEVFWARKADEPVPSGIKASDTTIENQFFRVRVNPDQGVIESIYDKNNKREIVPAGSAAGLLRILLEKPDEMSAWSIGSIVGHENLRGDTEVVLMDSGPADASLTFDHEYGDSQFTQTVTLHDSVPRIDLRISADWQEVGSKDKPVPMLEAAFPTNLANPKATFEIPFGSIERPTKGAEVPAQKWIDISDASYGVSLLNDCKYGFDVNGSVMRATLLRASYRPDPVPDKGLHEMLLSIYPHKGDWRAAGTARRGYEINEPLIGVIATAHKGSLPASQSFVSVDAPNVIVTALKKAEDDGSLILRFYEAHGTPCKAAVKVSLPVHSFVETDLLERPTGKKAPITNGRFTVKVAKHEIKTIKLLR